MNGSFDSKAQYTWQGLHLPLGWEWFSWQGFQPAREEQTMCTFTAEEVQNRKRERSITHVNKYIHSLAQEENGMWKVLHLGMYNKYSMNMKIILHEHNQET